MRGMLNVWIPPDTREPNGYCSICDSDLFGTLADCQKHMATCARRNIDEIRAAAPSVRHKGGPFDPELWDPEAEKHIYEVGKRMLAEGRLEMRENERIKNG